MHVMQRMARRREPQERLGYQLIARLILRLRGTSIEPVILRTRILTGAFRSKDRNV
jgi:hypothetical protein